MSELTIYPLHRFNLFETRDLDEARESVARVFCPHRLDLAGRQAFNAVHNRAVVGGLSINYMQYGSDVEIVPGALERFYLLQIPLSGSAVVRCGQQAAEASTRTATLLSPTQDVAMKWSWDCQKLLVQIEKVKLERELEAMLGRTINRPVDFDLAFSHETLSQAGILRLIRVLCEDLDDGAGVLTSGLAGARLSEALIAALLKSQRHTYSAELERDVPTIAPRHVKKAEVFIRGNMSDAIGLAEIADAAGVSVRALQEGFRRFRNTTPLEMLRMIRMEAARAELLAADPQDTVTTIALRWGFTHLSRFSGSYRLRYNETPSETLRNSGSSHVSLNLSQSVRASATA